MASDLREIAKDFSNERLLEEYLLKREQYTEAAQQVLKTEVEARGIPSEEQDAFVKERTNTVAAFDRQDFLPCTESFSQTDVLLATSILRELNIPFYIDQPPASMLPTEVEASRLFTLHIHKDHTEAAAKAFEEHFHKSDGRFAMKDLDLKERLKAINFAELRIPESVLRDSVDVKLSFQEKSLICGYAKRLIDEADFVESMQNRMLFYYDNLEDLIPALENKQEPSLSLNDLFTIMEILQVYCDEADFPASLDTTIQGLLQFTEEISAR
jgi:hypothetical protein